VIELLVALVIGTFLITLSYQILASYSKLAERVPSISDSADQAMNFIQLHDLLANMVNYDFPESLGIHGISGSQNKFSFVSQSGLVGEGASYNVLQIEQRDSLVSITLRSIPLAVLLAFNHESSSIEDLYIRYPSIDLGTWISGSLSYLLAPSVESALASDDRTYLVQNAKWESGSALGQVPLKLQLKTVDKHYDEYVYIFSNRISVYGESAGSGY